MTDHWNEVIIAPGLTNDAVTMAKAVGAALLVTGPASPFCHGANALRYWASQGIRIRWLVGDPIEALPGSPRQIRGHLNADGRLDVDAPWCGSIRTRDSSLYPRSGADQLAVTTGTGRKRIVAMCARSYDSLTASIMIPGLRECAHRLGARRVEVARARSGQLVIDTDRLTHRRLVALASDPERSNHHLQVQTSVYRALDCEWRQQRRKATVELPDLRAAAEMLRRFFSVVMLLHTSYSAVIEKCLTGLSGSTSLAMIPHILRWQLDEVGLFPAHKDIFEPGEELPVPGFTIDDDLTETAGSVRSAQPGSPGSRETHLVTVVVLKEWKFFLAKALHRHFSSVYRRLAGIGSLTAIPPDDVRRAHLFSDLLARLGDTSHVDQHET